VDERGVEFVAQVGDQAGERRAREAVLADKRGARNTGSSPVKQAVKAVDVVEFAQGFRIACSFSFDSPRRLFLLCYEVCCMRRALASLGAGDGRGGCCSKPEQESSR
jgi:hypothetical protein